MGPKNFKASAMRNRQSMALQKVNYTVGNMYWAPDEEEGWIPGKLISQQPVFVEVEVEGKGRIRVQGKAAAELEPVGLMMDADLDNLTNLDVFSEGSILHHIRKRALDRENTRIYTYVGNILVAVNPFQALPLYGKEIMDSFAIKAQQIADKMLSKSEFTPHIFGSTALAFQNMKEESISQSILISGESGAGKTETTKKALSYLAYVGGKKESVSSLSPEKSIEDDIIRTNPVLEAFGNAKTLRNDNSSRFGKWMKVNFEKKNVNKFQINGCCIINYLLEKSRVVSQNPGERNYHVFYMLLEGANEEELDRLDLKGGASKFLFLLNGENKEVVSCPSMNDAEEYERLVESMNQLQFSPQIQKEINNLLAAILHLGNVDFYEENGHTFVLEETDPSLAKVSQLLELDNSLLARAFAVRMAKAGRGSVMAIDLTRDQAIDTRDGMCKAIYSKLFDYLIAHLNNTLSVQEDDAATLSINLIDIFGFEVFPTNSFEQLCINYANEKLQNYFNDIIFKMELSLYEEEGINVENITYKDNAKCIELIEGRPISILNLLEEEANLARGNDGSFLNKMIQQFVGKKEMRAVGEYFHKNPTNPNLFAVKHFAGPVDYNIKGFVEKNRDTISDTLLETIAETNLRLLKELFKVENEEKEGTSNDSNNKSKRKQKELKTLGGQFRSQLKSLVNSLRETQPHFVRCLKSNHQKLPWKVDGGLCLAQMRYSGLFEAISIRKAGYPIRIPHSFFYSQFWILCYAERPRGIEMENSGKYKDFSVAILSKCIEENILPKAAFEIGNNRVFLKSQNDQNKLEDARSMMTPKYATIIQAAWRSWQVRKVIFKERMEREAEEKRLKQEYEKKLSQIIKCQSYGRRYLGKKAMETKRDEKSLEFTVREGNVQKLQNKIHQLKSKYQGNPNSSIQNKLIEAANILTDINTKESLKLNYDEALDIGDYREAKKLFQIINHSKSKVNSISSLFSIEESISLQQKMEKCKQKQEAREQLLNFIGNPEDYEGNDPMFFLRNARKYEVDQTLLETIEYANNEAVAKLSLRTGLRVAIEEVNFELLQDTLHEIKEKSCTELVKSKYFDEYTNANRLLHLLQMDRQMETNKKNFSEASLILTSRIRSTCQRIKYNVEVQKKKHIETEKDLLPLIHLTKSIPMAACIYRRYKWSVTLCQPWKEPQCNREAHSQSNKIKMEEKNEKKRVLLSKSEKAAEYAKKKLHVSYKQAREWQDKIERYGLYNSKPLSYEDYLAKTSRTSLKKLKKQNEEKIILDKANDDKAKHRWIPGG